MSIAANIEKFFHASSPESSAASILSEPSCKAGLLVFSKDRPFQLQQLLDSVSSLVCGVEAIVILCYRGVWGQQYDQVSKKYPHAVFVDESEGFDVAIHACMRILLRSLGPDGVLVFAVDDMLFVSSVCFE